MKKTLLKVLILSLFLASIIGLIGSNNVVSATVTDSNWINGIPPACAASSGAVVVNHPNASSSSAVGQTFTSTYTGNLTSIQIAAKIGSGNNTVYDSRSGYLKMNFYQITGSYGTTATPTGSAIATSTNTIQVSSILTMTALNTYAWLTFNFNSTLRLNATGTYAFAIELYNSTIDYPTQATGVKAGKTTSSAVSGNNFYYNNGWATAAGSDYDFYYLVGIDEPLPTPTPTATPSPTPTPYLNFQYNIYEAAPPYNNVQYSNPPTGYGGRTANLTQSVNYTIASQVLNNTLPYINGSYYLWATPRYNGTADWQIYPPFDGESYCATNLNNVHLIASGTYTNGYFIINFMPDYVYNSTFTFQGFILNGTVTGSSETFFAQFFFNAAEPHFIFVGSMSGGHFGPTWSGVATAPTEVYLQQRSTYSYQGTVWINNVLNGTGNFTLYSTGLGNSNLIFSTGTYSQVITGSVDNGTFTFNFASRQSTVDIYEGYRVTVTLDDGATYSKTYNFRWALNVWTATPVPSGNMGGGGTLDTTSINNNLNGFIIFFLLFLCIGGPTLLMGIKGGLPGMLIGGSFGIGLAVLAGWLPQYLVLFFGVAVVTAFLMFRNKNGS